MTAGLSWTADGSDLDRPLPFFQWHMYDTNELHWHTVCVGCKGLAPDRIPDGERRTDHGCWEPGCYGEGVRQYDVTEQYRNLLRNLGVVVALAAAAQTSNTSPDDAPAKEG